MSDVLIRAYQTNQEIPVLSTQYPDLDVKTAYSVQKAYVEQRLKEDQIVGYKVGITSEALQKRFGFDAPAAGVLLASGMKSGSPVIEISEFKRLVIETEIGFLVGKPITGRLENVSEFQECIQGVLPAIELPDLGFEDMEKLKGVDIIAANVSAVQFIAGRERPFTGLELKDVSVSLTLDGEVINEGKGSDAMGDPWYSFLWTANRTLEQGWKIEPGQIFITGALGQVIPGKAGKYVADFGELGEISFEIR
jgi:2-keto-4-pentenoate hydratase